MNQELCSVVVVGAMNPSIHHPEWYHTVGALSEDEVSAVLSKKGVVVIPDLAKFETSGVEIHCLQNNWQASTPDPARLNRLIEIASTVFAVLNHTPISAFGLNFKYVDSTGIRGLGDELASRLIDALPGLSSSQKGVRLGTLHLAYALDPLSADGTVVSREMNVALHFPKTPDDDVLRTEINFDHRFVPQSTGLTTFDLAAPLRASVALRTDAEEYRARLLTGLPTVREE